MKARNIIPSESISNYVERVLVIEHHEKTLPVALPLFANGSPTLVFTSTRGTMSNNSRGHLILFGQTILPETINFTDDFILIAYFFKPFSLLNIFCVAPSELTDKPINLDLLAPKKIRVLQEQLLNSDTLENMIHLLDNFIFNLITLSKKDSPIVKYVTEKIVHDPSKKVLGLVQKELHVTERTFQRLFEKHIGIAPNIYRRICQFNNAFQQLNNRNFHKLTDIAFENGYTDQSHYIRAFREFTNLTPTDYLDLGAPSKGQ